MNADQMFDSAIKHAEYLSETSQVIQGIRSNPEEALSMLMEKDLEIMQLKSKIKELNG